MALKLFLDEDVNPLLAQDLRRRGYDVITPSEIDRLGRSDREQLEYAREQGRVILTHNRDDFLELAKEYATRQITYTGILYVPQMPYGQLLKRVLIFLANFTETQTQNSFIWLP